MRPNNQDKEIYIISGHWNMFSTSLFNFFFGWKIYDKSKKWVSPFCFIFCVYGCAGCYVWYGKSFFWNTHLLPRLVGLFFENLDNCCLQLMNFLSVVYTHILYFRWRHRKVKLAFEQPNWWYLLSNDFSFKAWNEEWGNSTHYVETLNRDLGTTAISLYSCCNH